MLSPSNFSFLFVAFYLHPQTILSFSCPQLCALCSHPSCCSLPCVSSLVICLLLASCWNCPMPCIQYLSVCLPQACASELWLLPIAKLTFFNPYNHSFMFVLPTSTCFLPTPYLPTTGVLPSALPLLPNPYHASAPVSQCLSIPISSWPNQNITVHETRLLASHCDVDVHSRNIVGNLVFKLDRAGHEVNGEWWWMGWLGHGF